MTKPLLIEPEARRELDDAAHWYEEQRSALGQRFLDAVSRDPGSNRRLPSRWIPCPVCSERSSGQAGAGEGLPYHVIYLDAKDALRVLAIAHDRRRPGYWLGRPPGE